MSEVIHSDVTGKDYDIKGVIRLINQRQIATYMRSGILPVDIYPSVDYKDPSKPIMVYIFDKSDTEEIYKKWKESTDLWEEVNND